MHLQGSLTAVTLHAAAGAVSGGINAGITGDNVGLGALTGGIAGGLGAFVGPHLKDLGYPAQVAGRAFVGGVSGGIGAELAGGDFGQGFVTGATTGAIGALANDWLHEKGLPWIRDNVLKRVAPLLYKDSRDYALAHLRDQIGGIALNANLVDIALPQAPADWVLAGAGLGMMAVGGGIVAGAVVLTGTALAGEHALAMPSGGVSMLLTVHTAAAGLNMAVPGVLMFQRGQALYQEAYK